MQTSKISYLKQGLYKIDKQNPQMCIGKGSFGKVYKGWDVSKNTWVAIKQINIQLLQEYGQQMKQVILNQINVMRKFSKRMNTYPCQNLVKLYDCFRTDKFIYIVMEYCENGTLFDQLKVIEIARQLIEGLVYLQQMSIAHRDLKPQNIFITQNQYKQKIYKIGDFGFAAKKTSFNDVLGTYQYMAPQIFKREQYTSRVDIWSLGIILHQLLFNGFFYSGKNKWEIQDKIKTLQYKLTQEQCNKISIQMQQLLKLCLTRNKTTRPKGSQLKSNKIFNPPNQDNKSVFGILRKIIKRCQNLIQMSIQFERYGKQRKRNTIFIELYLLKFGLVQMNRTSYSISNKQNYINLPQQLFNQLISQNNSNKLQQLNNQSIKTWNKSNQIFNRKYNQFVQNYLSKFNQHDKQLISKTINNQPYEQPIMEIFVNQLKKWNHQFDSFYLPQQFGKLQQQSIKIINAFQANC